MTGDLSEDLRDAWERLRETAADFGEQRIYASHKSIMFSRRSCYFFVRPKRSVLELCVFLGRAFKAPQMRRVDSSRSEDRPFHPDHASRRGRAPITDWLHEASSGPRGKQPRRKPRRKPRRSQQGNRSDASASHGAILRATGGYEIHGQTLSSRARADGQRDGSRLVCAASSAKPCASTYIGPLNGENNERTRGPSIRSRRLHTRPVRGGPRASFDLVRARAPKPRDSRRRCGRS